MKPETIAILNFTTGEVIISKLSEREDANAFFERKGLNADELQWMRGDLKVIIENGSDKD